MQVLVACEESQRVCMAFRERGHEAYSCDIQDCSGGHPEWHIKQDVLPLINGRCTFTTYDGTEHVIDGKWDMLIAHPPCTYLSKAGANRLRINGQIQQERFLRGQEAAEFFMELLNADCDMVAVENPIPMKIFGLPKYSQIIQPYMFGDPWMKTTCLWLRGVQNLIPDHEVKPTGKWVNCSDHRKHKNSDNWSRSGVKKAKERSKTFPGIARAMAEQWGQKNPAPVDAGSGKKDSKKTKSHDYHSIIGKESQVQKSKLIKEIGRHPRRCQCGAIASHIGYGMAYCPQCYRRIYGEVRD